MRFDYCTFLFMESDAVKYILLHVAQDSCILTKLEGKS